MARAARLASRKTRPSGAGSELWTPCPRCIHRGLPHRKANLNVGGARGPVDARPMCRSVSWPLARTAMFGAHVRCAPREVALVPSGDVPDDLWDRTTLIGMDRLLRLRIPASKFTEQQLEIGRDLLRHPSDYDLLLDRLTPGGPAATALLINAGTIRPG